MRGVRALVISMAWAVVGCDSSPGAGFADARPPTESADAAASPSDGGADDPDASAAPDAAARIVNASISPPQSCNDACGGAARCDDSYVWGAISLGAGWGTYGGDACAQGFRCADVPPLTIDCINGTWSLDRFECACF